MEKLICPGCTAPLTPNTIQAALVCEYCGTAVSNSLYNEVEARAAAIPTLEEKCVQALIEMGEGENLTEVEDNCFGNPLRSITSARQAMDVPDQEHIYFLIDHLSIFGNVKEALALGESGLYYLCQGEEGHRSWEAFITGAISCEDRTSWTDAGRICIGTSLVFSVSSEADSRLARFLIDFHNRMYHEHTGKTAPADWAVTKPVEETQRASTPTLAGAMRAAAGSLLRPRTTIRPVLQRTVRPAPVQRGHLRRMEPPRPVIPVRQPAPVQRPGSMSRTVGGHKGPGGPGMGLGGRGMGGPGGRGGCGPGGRGRR